MERIARCRLIYDASIFREGGIAGSGRSGIFVTAYELLRALVRDGRLEISLYAAPVDMPLVGRFLRSQPELRMLPICNEFECRGIRWALSVLERKEFHLRAPKYGLLRPFIWVVYRPFRWFALRTARLLSPWLGQRNRKALMRTIRHHDAFLSPLDLAPEEVRTSGIPCFYIFYDAMPLLFPQFYPRDIVGVMWTENVMRNLRPVDRGFAISENTKRDYLRLVPGLREDHLTVISLAAAERFHPEPCEIVRQRMRMRYGIPAGRPYFLSLCTIEPRKNLPFALKVFARLHQSHPELLFVLAGGSWAHYRHQWEETLASLGPARCDIVVTGYVADEDQAALYSDALAFVYPSLYEGFGLPPLEAMQCGCPVLSSNTSSLPEVVGEAALTVAPDDFGGMLSAMERMVTDAGLRDGLRRCGLERSRLFSWGKSASIIADRIRICTEGQGR